jgi:SAM-dependent methyltransferase
MVEANVTSVYDRLGETYRSDEHKSVRFYNDVQRSPIYFECVAQAKKLNKPLKELDVLNIGVGGGQQRFDLCIYGTGLGYGRLSDHKLVDLDNSQNMLDVSKKIFPKKAFLESIENTKENIKQVKGDARELDRYFKEDKFDIVVAALCDHIEPQEKMYCDALKVLKKDGIFITTYPHKKLSNVIRKDIYGIDPSCTRYIIDGKEYLLHSYAALPEDVSGLFRGTGFTDIKTRTLTADYIFFTGLDVELHREPRASGACWWDGKVGTCSGHKYVIPDTMMKAREKLGISIGELPILVFGRGRKSKP